MFPNSQIHGLEWLLPVAVIALAWSDVMLSALAYRHDVGATVRARAIVEPWTISIAAFALAYVSKRDGLIFAYALSMVGALAASAVPFLKSYGVPVRLEAGSEQSCGGWRGAMLRWRRPTRSNGALGASTSRSLGLFFSPAVVGIYYVAQNVASLPSKLKTSFDPILGPVIARNLAAGDKGAVAKQVRQVGFWVIGAQMGVALALGIPGEGVMGLVGPAFVAGTAALAFLLAAEVVAAMAAVSEAALIYVARHRNMLLELHDDHPAGDPVGRPDPGHARAGAAADVAGDRAGDGAAARARLRRGRQVAAAAADPRSAGVRLALAADLRRRGGDRRRRACDPGSGMGRAAVRNSGDPAVVRLCPVDPRLRPRGPRAVQDAQGGHRRDERCRRRRRARPLRAELVAEVAHAGEQHRQAGLVGGGDDFVVADRAAGLDHRRGAGFDRGEQAVGEGEEGVRRNR